MIEIVIISFVFVVIILVTWFNYCNSKTLDQRRQIREDIRLIRPADVFTRQWAIHDSVSYKKHLWYLVTFRDPHKLYDL